MQRHTIIPGKHIEFSDQVSHVADTRGTKLLYGTKKAPNPTKICGDLRNPRYIDSHENHQEKAHVHR